jgi:hypothetical protein
MPQKDLPYRENSMLRRSYSLIAPLYDMFIARPMMQARTRSLRALPAIDSGKILLSGIGTGLDLPLLPKLHHYTALDFNAAMLERAKPTAWPCRFPMRILIMSCCTSSLPLCRSPGNA